MSMRRFVSVALFLAIQALATLGEGTVLCVGDSGHRDIERAGAGCCIKPISTTGGSSAWSGAGPCGTCTDYPYASASVTSDVSRAQPNGVSALVESSGMPFPRPPVREALASLRHSRVRSIPRALSSLRI